MLKNKRRKNLFSSNSGTGLHHYASIDVLKLLSDAGIAFRTDGENVSEGWVGVCCPFCGDDTNYHMGINISTKVTSCFRCGKSGSLLSLLNAEIPSIQSNIDLIKKHTPRELKQFNIKSKLSTNNISEVVLPKNYKHGLSDRHRGYVHGRGYDPDILIEEYNLLHTGPVSDFPNRVIVPVVVNYKLVSYTSFTIADMFYGNKYRHIKDEKAIVPIKNYLYNLHTVQHIVIVVEGLFDCWRIGKGSVPTFGTKVTQEQLILLATIPNVVILFDGDAAGITAGKQLAEKLAPFTNVKQIIIPDERDPDKLSYDEIMHIKRMI